MITQVTLSVTVVPGPVAVFCMVYHYTKRAMLTRLLGNVGLAIYVVLLNKYFVILVMETLDSTELLMEDQAWLDYLWDFKTREINLDLSSDTD